MNIINEMTLTFKALSENEGFARSAVAAFCIQLNPTLDEITDIKTAVSEAVTNCVVHAYPKGTGNVSINVKLSNSGAIITISDNGIGMPSIKSEKPNKTTKKSEKRKRTRTQPPKTKKKNKHNKTKRRKMRDGVYCYGKFYGQRCSF